MIDGTLACIYLGALLYAAPLLDRTDVSFATRLRNVAVLGIALPLSLALVHALYAPVLWVAVAGLVLARFRSQRPTMILDRAEALTLCATMAIAFASLVRPVLDGDSLLYHLPIAVSWVQAHSLWTTSSPYWYYPAGSEAFVAGLFQASGRFALPLAGILPLLMITARLYEVGVARGASRWCSGAIALAFACTPTVSLHVGTLGNDLWIAALFLEALAARSTLALAMLALVKPIGWLWGTLAATAGWIRPLPVLLALGVVLVWTVRDVILYAMHPIVAIAPQPAYFASTIAGHVPFALIELTRSIFVQSPQVFIWIALAIAGMFARETRSIGITGLIALVLPAFFPLTFSGGDVDYTAVGTAVRFFFPALACGALVALSLASRAEGTLSTVATLAWVIVAAAGAIATGMIFANDLYTLLAPIAATLLCLTALFPLRYRTIAMLTLAAIVVVQGAAVTQLRSPGFFANWMRDRHGQSTKLFVWLAEQTPARVVALDLRGGSVIMTSPKTHVEPATDAGDACKRATQEHAVLVVGNNESLDPSLQALEREAAMKCGLVLFEDGASLVVVP